jgi:hypothetical protein
MKLTATEVVDTLTGWEEIAIEQSTGKTLEMMQNPEHPNNVLLLRCLAAVLKWREAVADGDLAAKFHASYHQVMGMTQSDVNGVFSDESEDGDILEGEPDSEAGKDDSPRPVEPNAWPDSVSQPESHQISTPV